MKTRHGVGMVILALICAATTSIRAAAAAPGGPPPPLAIAVEADGLVALTGADLQAAGWDLAGLDPAALCLPVEGQAVALWVSAATAPLHADDVLLFYGQRATDRYGPRNVYRLSVGDGPGLRMAERDAAPAGAATAVAWWPATLHAEQDTAPWGYWQNPPGRAAQDHWYWTGPLAAPARADLPFELPPFEPTAGPFTLRVALAGRTDAPGPLPDHHTRLLLNGHPLADAYWDGQIPFVHAVPFTPTLIATGVNTVTVVAVGDTGAAADSIYVNWIEVDYAARYIAQDDRLAFHVVGTDGRTLLQVAGFRTADIAVYDITDPRRPVRLRNTAVIAADGGFAVHFADDPPPGARYLALTPNAHRRPAAIRAATALTDLRDPAQAADEVIVVYDEWFAEVEPLVARRRAQGWRVVVVRVSKVYDAFAWGRATPHALRAFLAYAYRSWQVPPTHVLLIGDANLDYADRFDTGRPNFVPTYIFDASDVGETASDAWFVQLAGDDAIPEMAIGRLPAISAADLRALIAKILAYETAADGLWRSRALFVADNVPAHQAVAENWLTRLPPAYVTQRVFAAAYPPGDPAADIAAAINRGVALVVYIGHGNVDRWGLWSGGRLFDVATIGRLANAPQLPFVVTADCLNGFFVHPYTDATIAEALLRRPDGGAVAVWSSSSLGTAAGQALLFAALLRELTANPSPVPGRAIMAATAAAARAGVSSELLSTYILFGDPAMRLRLAPAARLNLPLLTTP
ncbi:MAG: C25 family cysteine peptidase [Anaerolineae bacterium]|nr:C25 family cysteine peptidase [Anaerolineae bacterium]